MKRLIIDDNGMDYDVYLLNNYSGWDRYEMSEDANMPNGVNMFIDNVSAFTPKHPVNIWRVSHGMRRAIARRWKEREAVS